MLKPWKIISFPYVMPILTLAVMGLSAWYVPAVALDPWNLINLNKILTMIFALTFIQFFSVFMNRFLGVKMGAIMTGFFGGLISSTATTATLARKSKINNTPDNVNEVLIFLSATGAMLIEAAVLVWSGTNREHLDIMIVFIGPMIATLLLIILYSKKGSEKNIQAEEIPFEILPILKLAMFIIGILLMSKLLQNFFGQYGIMIITFLVSLFEIHGSVMANVQLHEDGVVGTTLLGSLVCISIVSSSISKFFLIFTLGNSNLRRPVFKCTAILFFLLFINWVIFVQLLRS
ncbi:MAG: DUF4010 domain-containing protein [Pseudobdellovibrionaceae bacterium]